MNTKNKLVILFLASVLILLAALLLFRQTQERQNGLILKSAADQQSVLINAAILVQSNQLDEIVTDYSNWDDLIPRLETPDPKWAVDNIASITESFKLFSVQVYNENNQLVYRFGNQKANIFNNKNTQEKIFSLMQEKGFLHFFQRIDEGLLEISVSSIHYKSDSAKLMPSKGNFFVSRIWDERFIHSLEINTASKISFEKINGNRIQLFEDDSLVVSKPLFDFENQVMQNLVAKKPNNVLVNYHLVSDFIFYSLGTLLFIFLSIFFIIIYGWIRSPLKIISDSLQLGDSSNLWELEKHGSEFSQIARLVTVVNNQKLELERENTEINRIQTQLIQQSNLLRSISNASNHLLYDGDFESAIHLALETISIATGINRIFIYKKIADNYAGGRRVERIYDYTLKKISGEVDNDEIEATFNHQMNDWFLTLSEGKIIREYVNRQVTNKDEISEEKPVLSMMIAPIMDQNEQEFWGFLSFTDSATNHIWTDEEETLLIMLARNIGVSIRRQNSQEELKKAMESTKNADRAKSEFLASMSHEIRTPMNGVIGMTSLLQLTDLTPTQREYVNIIENSGEDLMSIINEILDFSKIESGKIELEESPFDLRICIEDVLDLVATKALEKHLEIIYYIDPVINQFIHGDGFRLRQILVNLVSNAIKFTEKGDILINVSPVSKGETNVILEFSVRDTGIGIPPDKVDSLFSPFTQVDSSTTRKYGGTGLGLAISSSLVKLMNGMIWVESQEGIGSTFHFTIQTKYSFPDTDMARLSKTLTSIQGKTVLIVDDNQTNLMVLRLQCEYWGIKVTTATKGIEALKLLEKNTYDIGILDMQMPEMDGVMLAREIRNRFSLVHLPLIMLTSVGFNTESAELKRLFSFYVNKPIKHTQLAEIIVKALSPVKKTNARKIADLDKLITTAQRYPFTILLAEDNMINQKLIINIFKLLGYKTDIAANGIEALEALKRKNYNLIFMDIQMPLMNGYEATRIIVEHRKEERPLIIAMTANAMAGDREKCIETGMDDYISKPVKIEVLLQVIQLWGERKFPKP